MCLVAREILDNMSDNTFEVESEALWNSLSKEEQLKVFCAVVKRIYLGEFKEMRSYRGMLYGVFGFGKDSYSKAQEAGFVAIHNGLYDSVSELENINDDYC